MEGIQIKDGDQKFNFSPETEHEVIIRKGEAEPVISLTSESYNTDLYGPAELMLKSKLNDPVVFENMQQKYSILTFNDNSICYVENSVTNQGGRSIKGELFLNKELKSLGINTDKSYDNQSLIKTLKYKRTMFATEGAYDKLMKDLNQYKASFESEIQNEKDNQGNKNISKVIKNKNTDVIWFNLKSKLYSNKEHTFRVELVIEVTSTSYSISLESLELHDLLIMEAEKLIETQIDIFKANNIPVLKMNS